MYVKLSVRVQGLGLKSNALLLTGSRFNSFLVLPCQKDSLDRISQGPIPTACLHSFKPPIFFPNTTQHPPALLSVPSHTFHYAHFHTFHSASTEPVLLNVYRAQESIQGMNSASLCSLAGRHDNPIPTQFVAP
jgi:hypothetical protein